MKERIRVPFLLRCWCTFLLKITVNEKFWDDENVKVPQLQSRSEAGSYCIDSLGFLWDEDTWQVLHGQGRRLGKQPASSFEQQRNIKEKREVTLPQRARESSVEVTAGLLTRRYAFDSTLLRSETAEEPPISPLYSWSSCSEEKCSRHLNGTNNFLAADLANSICGL